MMDRDEIRKIAGESGLIMMDKYKPEWWSVTSDELNKFADAIEARTKEKCIEIAKNQVAGLRTNSTLEHVASYTTAQNIADKIRDL